MLIIHSKPFYRSFLRLVTFVASLIVMSAAASASEFEITAAHSGAAIINKQVDGEQELILNRGFFAKPLRFKLSDNSGIFPKGKVESLETEIEFYRGSVAGAGDTWARFTNHNGIWSGAFYDGTDLYLLDSREKLELALATEVRAGLEDLSYLAQNFKTLSNNDYLIVYRAKDVVYKATCGVSGHNHDSLNLLDALNIPDGPPVQLAAGEIRSIDISLVADSEYDDAFSGNGEANMLAQMNIVDGIFSEQLNVYLNIVDTRALSNNGPLTSTNAESLLFAFRDYASANVPLGGVKHLFTGKDLNGNTLGIAFVGALCNSFAIGLSQEFVNFRGTTLTSLVVAHELGHNFGAEHDGDVAGCTITGAGPFLMAPSINGSDTFSNCSVAQIESELSFAGCVSEGIPAEITSSANTSAQAGVAYSYNAAGRIEFNGDDVSLNLDIAPAGMTLAADGTLEWTPSAGQVGDNEVQISASNSFGIDRQLFTVTVTPPSSSDFLNFNDYTLSSYGGSQDEEGTVNVGDDGFSLALDGNRWQKIDFAYNITPNTVLEFTFASNAQGEIHGIGLDNNNTIEQLRTLSVWGTQFWGNRTYRYDGSGDEQRFVIPIGQLYTGSVSNMFFAMDHDVNSPNAQSVFSDITVYEDTASSDVIDFNALGVVNYAGSQNVEGSFTVVEAGAGLQINGNRWLKVPLPTTVTADTMLEFEFASSSQGEIHGIGFDSNDAIEDSATLQVFGTQNWGVRDFTYTGNGNFQSFSIPIGQYYTGGFSHLYFVMDHDVTNPDGESIFRNVTVR
ncbi:M12 family metallo-peptidase [Ningiella sp. W23]|uniref:M12 family metallo-peptidase n=1 Tax=Ningiella sp. W23 TaxID=3023715 RepID=UPI0037576A89